MASITLPAYLKWRDGRPRWEPGPKLRARGWKGRDLKDDIGQWLGLEAAIEQAAALNRDVAAWRSSGEVRPTRHASAPDRTCRALATRFYASADFQRLGERTRRDYQNKLAIFLASEFGAAPVRAVTKPQLVGYWQELYDARGHAMANGIKACISLLMTHAELIGWRAEGTNPALKMKRPALEPRCVLWLPYEITHLVAVADAVEPAIGDGIVIALHTGQRQADVLDFGWQQMQDGRALFQPQKTSRSTRVRIAAPLSPPLLARLDAIRARQRTGAVVALQPAGPVITGPNGRYVADTFRHRFAEIRAHAALALPAIADKRFQDLRDTAVTRLALAGCELAEICAITGHSAASAVHVIRHYLVLQPAHADTAIAKLSAWLTTNRIAI